MKKEIANAWIAALRSGEYRQGKGVLRRNNSFCCLGVLCELARKENIVKGSISIGSDLYRYNDQVYLIPEKVRKWADLRDDTGERGKRKVSLATLNDSSKYSFKRIADVIEKEWETL